MTWSPSFSGLNSSVWTLSVVVAIIVALAMFVLLRRYEATLVRPAVGRTLFVLRLMVLVLLLLTLLKPVLTKSSNIENQQRLVVAFDVSESMDTADQHASPAEMLRWAQALGMLGNSDTRELLDQWVAAWENGDQPDFTSDVGRRQVDEVFDEIRRMPRTEFVRRLLQSQPNHLLEQLSKERVIDLRVFGTHQQSIEDRQLSELLNGDREELRPGGTDVVHVLTRAIGEEHSNTIQGIVLLTDGRQTVTADAATEAARLKALGIPVYCVPIGSRLSPRDLSIASVQVPQTVFVEDTAQLHTTITSTGYAGDDVTVLLTKDGVTVDQKTVTVAADYFEVEFGIPTSEVGHHQYTVSTDVQPGELRDDNNFRDFTVSVVDNQSHVLLVEGDARWEFRYLKSALERDKRVDLSPILFRQPFLQLLNRTFLDNSLPDGADFETQLSTTDILIFGDVDPAEVSDDAWRAIEKAVSDDGLTLLIVPGRRYMPHRFDSPVLKQLLPVSGVRQQLAERFKRSLPDAPPSAFHLHPAADAADLTLFNLTAADSDHPMELSQLPGHPWAYTGEAKPAASVWATLEMEGVGLNDDMSAVVHQYYGFGQVVWLGIDSTWRWRRRAGDTWHHQFWGQIVRWAARNKSAAGNDQVRMTLSEIVADDTDSVDVAVRWNPNLVSQLKDATVEVIVENVDDPEKVDPAHPTAATTQKVMLLPLEGAPERFSAKLPPLPPGGYTVRLNVVNSRVKLEQPVVSELLIRRQLSSELANISCNRDFLQQLATQTDGQLLEPWQLSELPEMLRSENSIQSVVQEITLWDHWGLMLLFFVLLTAEWILRKLHGLP
ncbi:MAG: VWA domain-containing protein [Planctomycetaceae bacterium]